VGKVIHSTLEPQRALQLIIDEAVGLTRASSGSVVLINPTTNFLEIQASRGLPEDAHLLKLRRGGCHGLGSANGQAGSRARCRQRQPLRDDSFASQI
jgi:hypothetical protein